MRRTTLALITASILSLAACGGDDTSPTGGSGSGGTGGSGGSSATGGTGGKAGTGGTGMAGTGGSGGSGGGGQAGTTPGDASTPDVRRDTTPATDATIDRPPTIDAPGSDGGTSDTTPPPDGAPMDTSPPPDGSQPDGPPTDGPRGDAPADARDAGGTDGSAAMVLTSSGFVEGAMIPADFTCAGTNVSPPLQWTPGPAGTMSYALVFTDRNNSLIHSIIYDIPSSVTSLPMAVERTANPTMPAGAKQLAAYDGTPGYAGPCPSGILHTYEFSIRAIDVAALPGVTTSSMRPIVEPIITMHTLARGVLTGQSNAKK